MKARPLIPVLLAGVLGIALADRSMIPLVAGSLRADLSLDDGGINLFINGYAIAQVAVIALASHLAGVLGRRRVLITGLIVGALGLTLVATATTASVAIMGRVVAGFGVGAALPASLAIVAGVAPGDIGRSVGRYLGVGSLVMLLAPLFAGLVIRLGSWRLAIVGELIVLLISLGAAVVLVERDTAERGQGLALVGGLLAGGAFSLLSLGAQRIGADGFSAFTLILLITGAVLLIALVLHTMWSHNPVFSQQVIRAASVRRDAAATLLLGGLVGVVLVFVALLLTQELKLTPLTTALVLITLLLPQVVVAHRAGAWYDRVGFVAVARRGITVLVPASLLLALGARLEVLGLLMLGLLAMGIGLGLLVTLTSSDPQRAMSSEFRPETSGLISSSRNLGGAGLVAIGFTLSASFGPAAPFWLVVAIAVGLVPILLRRIDSPDSAPRVTLEAS